MTFPRDLDLDDEAVRAAGAKVIITRANKLNAELAAKQNQTRGILDRANASLRALTDAELETLRECRRQMNALKQQMAEVQEAIRAIQT